jgi:3-methyladenine DNA glycosylase/8-oxoguanine DNA glycosylase
MQITLNPPVPFTLKHLKRVYSSRSDPSCLWIDNVLYFVLINKNNDPFLTKIEELGTPNQPVLLVTSASEFDCFPKISHLFSFQDDLKSFYQTIRSDPVMNQIVKQYYGTRIFHARSFFESAVIAILEQQISVQAATKIRERFINRFGRGPIQFEGMNFRAFPTPHDLLESSIDEIRLVGISMNKARAIYNLAQCLVEGSFQVQSLSPHFKELS